MNALGQASHPSDEIGRLQALYALQILDTPPERELDDLVQLAAAVCNAPIGLLTMVDAQRQWFKAAVGLTMQETSRDISFCSHAIQSPDLFVVEDATLDARFADNPLVTEGEKIRFYAGMPLETQTGYAIGTLCVIDTVPRRLDPQQEQALRVLADQVKARMELRLQTRALEAALREKEEIGRGLRESEAQFRLFMNHSPFASYIKDEDGRMLYYNQTVAQRFGVSQNEWLQRTDAEIWPEKLAIEFRKNDLTVLFGGKPITVVEHTQEADGSTTWWKSSKFPYRDSRGRLLLAGISVDITEELKRKTALEQANLLLQELATVDGLTGLKNRRTFEERLQIEFSTARRKQRQLSLLMLDVDNFKQINDTWGHAAGDEVLRNLGRILASTVRMPDTAARYGGEEFVVLLPDTPAENVMIFAQRLKASIAAESWEYGPITVSCGVSTLVEGMARADELTEAADRGLYAAKRAGKDRILVGM